MIKHLLEEDLLENEIPANQDLEFQFDDYDLSTDGGKVYFSIWNSDDPSKVVLVTVEVSCDTDSVNFDWEPDGAPTYVPYGEGSVLYDNGEGGLDSVDASNSCSSDDITYQNESEEDITEEQALDILECSKEELDRCVNLLKVAAESQAAEWLEDYYLDNPPEKPEYEPDYDY